MATANWILVAEDNENDELLIRRAFAESAISQRIIVAHDGREVVQCLLREGRFRDRPAGPPSVILMDERMPLMSGIETLQFIRRHPQLRLMPVVMHSAAMTEAEVQEAYELGANGFIEKPANYEEFRRIFVEFGIYWGAVNIAPSKPLLTPA